MFPFLRRSRVTAVAAVGVGMVALLSGGCQSEQSPLPGGAEKTVAPRLHDPGLPVTPAVVLAAWRVPGALFAVEMEMESVRHKLWWAEDKGAAIRLVFPANEAASEVTLFRDGNSVNLERSGGRFEHRFVPEGARYDRGLALGMVLPPAGMLTDTSLTWTSEPGPSPGLVTMTGRGDALEVRLVVAADTLFPVEFVAQSGGDRIGGRFEFARLIARSSSTDRMFEAKRLKSWFD
jgi:hypothetical protein